jgi:hypothetical protein
MDWKALLSSKTIAGILLMIVPVIFKMAGHELSSADASGLITQGTQMINDALTFGGMVIAIWGRATAKAPLVKPAA